MGSSRSPLASTSAVNLSHRDVLAWAIWCAGITLVGTGAALRGPDLARAATETVRPFATVGVVVVAGWASVWAGWFEGLGRRIPHDRPAIAVAMVLALTALVSGLVNLDVAVVVVLPLALGVAAGATVDGELLILGVANVANACSFLLPTSNLTNLLVMGPRSPAPVAFVLDAGLAWATVTAVTVGAVTWLATRSGGDGGAAAVRVDWPLGRVLGDLGAMFLVATGLRALLARPLILPGGFALQAAVGGAAASALNNLPVASVVRAGVGAPWPAILAMGAGSNLLITGSIASVICRRFAREGGVGFPILRFTLLGLVLLPAQLALAFLGLHVAGVAGM